MQAIRRFIAALSVLIISVGISAGVEPDSQSSRPSVIVPAALPPSACFVVPGSYFRSDADLTNGPIDQIVLRSDGTASWNQAGAVAFIQSQGTFTPGIGAWTCGPDDTVVMSAISFEADTGNSDVARAVRETYQLKFDRNDPDHPVIVQRWIIDFDFPGALPSGSALDPNGGTVVSTPLTASRPLARIKPFLSDLSR
jgi:hypothetical protein